MSEDQPQLGDGAPMRRRIPERTGEPRAADVRTAADAGIVGVRSSPDPDRAKSPRDPEPTEELRRVPRNSRLTGQFTLPERYQKPGWDYQWEVVTVLNQPTDSSRMAEAYDAAWRPEHARDWPASMMPPGTPPDSPIVRGGQQLMGRPMHFTHEARAEDHAAALEQQAARLRGSAEGRNFGTGGEPGLRDIPGVRTVPLGMQIEGEHGTYASSPIPERPAR